MKRPASPAYNIVHLDSTNFGIMNNILLRGFGRSLLLLLLFLGACTGSNKVEDFSVVIWELDEPQGFNPITATDATSLYPMPYLFQKLLTLDYDSYKLVPILAAERPQIDTMSGSPAMKLTYNLRPEATWPNGSDITAQDVIFSYKVIVCPSVNNEGLRHYLDNVDSITVDPTDPKRFTVYCHDYSNRVEYETGYETWIIPQYHYDSLNQLGSYSFHQLKTDTSLAQNAAIKSFAQQFNDVSMGREPEKIVGSGPYEITSWTTGQDVVMQRKEDWWGNKVEADDNEQLEAYPSQLIIKIISDQTAAVTALKAGEIDVMRSIPAKTFEEDLMSNERVKQQYNLITNPSFYYSVFVINTQSPLLSDVKTRKALAHLVNYDRIINDLFYGYATRISSPIPASFEGLHNDTLKPYDFNLETAKNLLKQAGWEDTDRDGILEKTINGKEREFRITFLVNSGSVERENVVLVFQETLAQAGIKLDIEKTEWGNYLERAINHDFEMMYMVWASEPTIEDFAQQWHTRSAQGGYNLTSFGTAETDQLIEQMNRTLDEKERAHLTRLFQEILHHEVPYIFLWRPNDRLAISKRFTNTHVSALRPGYWAPGFQLAESP